MSSSYPDPVEGDGLSRSALRMKRMFPGVELVPEDLYLLEPFQLGYLPGWAPEAELACLLRACPGIETFMRKSHPPIDGYLDRIIGENPGSGDRNHDDAQELLWTLADMLVYGKCPEVYDSLEFHGWDFGEITSIVSLKGATVLDAGAGTGRVAFEAALHAEEVYAVEPVGRLRDFMREKARKTGLGNVHVTDGFLHSLPFSNGFFDVLITSHALGWKLEEELPEMERVVTRGGSVIHCPGTLASEGESGAHIVLTSPPWNYRFSVYEESDGSKRKYWKEV